tara:strand:- start:267 stop:1217 length:951 start_codon:yes stop_codon:yes gene_type:complete
MIKSYTLENKYLRIKTLNLGATLFEVFHKKKKINLILNLDKISSYKKNKNYLGSTCGRYANRIKNAQFKIKNKKYKLTKNAGRNILHGGKKGFDSKIWLLKDLSKNHITYKYISPDGEEGFPGELTSFCKFFLKDNCLNISIQAISSNITHVNIVNHAYWNLDKIKKNIFGHKLFINSDFFLENDKDNIPTGKKVSVKNTQFDFRNLTNIGDKIKKKGSGFDENFIVRNNSNLIAKLISQKTNIQLSVYSNQPGVQFYTGQNLRYFSKNKKLYPYQGMCLETQKFPNSPNNIKFPSSLLKARQTYRHNMKFKISDI